MCLTYPWESNRCRLFATVMLENACICFQRKMPLQYPKRRRYMRYKPCRDSLYRLNAEPMHVMLVVLFPLRLLILLVVSCLHWAIGFRPYVVAPPPRTPPKQCSWLKECERGCLGLRATSRRAPHRCSFQPGDDVHGLETTWQSQCFAASWPAQLQHGSNTLAKDKTVSIICCPGNAVKSLRN